MCYFQVHITISFVAAHCVFHHWIILYYTTIDVAVAFGINTAGYETWKIDRRTTKLIT